MLYDYGTSARLTSELVREWVYQKRDLGGFAERVKAGKYRFFSGHFPLNTYLGVLPAAQFVSWVRRPVERIWSAYRHHTTHRGFEGSFRDFYRQPRFQNQQSRFIGGDPGRLEFVGLTERFGPCLARFNQRFGVRFMQHHANRTPSGGSESWRTEDLAEIASLNTQDEALYQAVEQRLLIEGTFGRARAETP
jgi:hypothetical protein